MADRSGLGMIGLMFGAATLLVMIAGTVVVGDHLTGRLQIDEGLGTVTLPSSAPNAVISPSQKSPATSGALSFGRMLVKRPCDGTPFRAMAS